MPINTFNTTPVGQGRSVTYDLLKTQRYDIEYRPKAPYYDPSASYPLSVLLDGTGTPDIHRHFGSIVKTKSGRLIIAYRKAPSHGTQENTTITMLYSDNDGADWSSEVDIVSEETGKDNRAALMGVTPTGRILLGYNRIHVAGATAQDPQEYKLIYSDDDGVNWSSALTIDSIEYDFARLFGSVEVVPSDVTPGETMTLITSYQRTSGAPVNYAAAYYKSYDEGLTWSSPVYVVNDTQGLNEMGLQFFNADVGVAVCRGNSGLALFTTVNAGSTWTSVGVITGTDDDCVAPSLNQLTIDSEPYLLLGYTDRGSNQAKWTIVPLFEVFGAAPLTALADFVVTGQADMENASGYQKAVIYPNGDMAYVEFKEFNGDEQSQVRFGKGSPRRWAQRRFSNDALAVTPTLITALTDLYVNRKLFTITAASNATTDYPLTVTNHADNYGLQVGAYGMSNRTYGATSVDYTVDIGGDLVIKLNNVERFRLKDTGLLQSASATYENLVTADDDIPNAKWVTDQLYRDLGEYTVAGLPAAASYANAYAVATDASGGRTVVRSDGTNWKVIAVEGATVA
jgi:hypothetical protein